MNKISIVLFLYLATGSAIAGPFCVVYSGGQLCNYFDVSSCQSAARSMQGVCAPNSQPSQMPQIVPSQPQRQLAPAPVQPIYPDYAGSMMRGIEAGQKSRLRKAEIEQRELQNKILQQQLDAKSQVAPSDQITQSIESDDLKGVGNARDLYIACQYAQEPKASNYPLTKSFQAIQCMQFARGAFATAMLSKGFSSPDGEVEFCGPRKGSTASDLIDAIVSTGKRSPETIEPGFRIESFIVIALSKISDCPVNVK